MLLLLAPQSSVVLLLSDVNYNIFRKSRECLWRHSTPHWQSLSFSFIEATFNFNEASQWKWLSIMYAQLLIKKGIRTLFSFRIENAMNNVVYFWEYIYFSPYKEMHIACWADNSIYVCLHEWRSDVTNILCMENTSAFPLCTYAIWTFQCTYLFHSRYTGCLLFCRYLFFKFTF